MVRQLNHHCRQMKKTIVLLALWVSVGLLAAAPVDTSAFDGSIRVACIGDSITAGVGATRDNSYPTQLGRMLGGKWAVMNFGVSGATLLNHGDKPYQKETAFKRALESHPDVVVIKLGTNDTKPKNWKFKDEFLADFKDLILQFARLPGKPRIYICRPAFVPGNGNFGINEAGVLEEIPMLDEIATAEKVDVIDIHAALKDHPEMLPDRVHPNNAGATVMAKTVFQALTGKEFTGAAPIFITETGK